MSAPISRVALSQAPHRSRAAARKSHPDTFRPSADGDREVQQFQQLARAFRSQPTERGRQAREVERATAPRASDTPEAREVREQYRAAWERANQEYERAQRAIGRGPGKRDLPGGGSEEVIPGPDGRTDVITRFPDGRTRLARVDGSGQLYVKNTGPDGEVESSLYRKGTSVTLNLMPDSQVQTQFTLYDGIPHRLRVENGPRGQNLRVTKALDDGQVEKIDTGWNRFEADNDAASVRRVAGGLDGSGVAIGILDDNNEFTGLRGQHAGFVGGVAGDVAPGAQQVHMGLEGSGGFPTLPPDLPDDPAALDRALLETGQPFLDQTSARLARLANDSNRDPTMRVLNLSGASTRSNYYQALHNALERKNPDGSWKYPELRHKILGEGADATERARRIAQYVDARLDRPDSAYQRSLRNFRAQAQRLEELGISFVASASNGGGSIWERVRPGSELSDLATSPHVITVGSAGPDGRPLPLTPAGDLTLIAPGRTTSLSAPYVSGVIAMMLQANPRLTPQQIRDLLRQASRERVLDAGRALELARAS